MMQNHTELGSSNVAFNQTLDIRISGEFDIDNHHFLIIGRDDYPDAHLSSHASPFNPIGRFEVNGKPYLIVQHGCAPEPSDAIDLTTFLTERELQIVALVAEGKVNKQIAKHLRISEWTVATYLRRIFTKLGVESRAAMVYRCAPFLNHLRSLHVSGPTRAGG